MTNWLKTPALYLGLIAGGAIGYGFGSNSPPAPQQSDSANAESPDFSFMTEQQIREYYTLKTMKERYEKADELLGKFVLALIAGRFMDVSDNTRMNVENSAGGRANSMPAPRCESIDERPVDTQLQAKADPLPAAPPSGPAAKTKPSSTIRADSLSVVSNPETGTRKFVFEPGQTEVFNFAGKASYKTTPCKDDPEWFVSEGQKSYFAAEPDPDLSVTELVGTIVSTSLQKSELTLLHCLNSTYKNWRVKVSMMVKGEGVRNARMVSVRWLPKGDSPGIKRNNYPFQGSFDWRRIEYLYDLGNQPFAVGVEMIGQGKVFLKEVTVTRVQNLRPYD